MIENSLASVFCAFILLLIITIFSWVGFLNSPAYKPKDKKIHLIGSFFTAFIVGIFAFITGNPIFYFISVGFSWLVWIVGKELIWDKLLGRGQFEMEDIYADIVGSFALNLFTLFTIALGIEYFTRILK